MDEAPPAIAACTLSSALCRARGGTPALHTEGGGRAAVGVAAEWWVWEAPRRLPPPSSLFVFQLPPTAEWGRGVLIHIVRCGAPPRGRTRVRHAAAVGATAGALAPPVPRVLFAYIVLFSAEGPAVVAVDVDGLACTISTKKKKMAEATMT
jgi:hypothetical protein